LVSLLILLAAMQAPEAPAPVSVEPTRHEQPVISPKGADLRLLEAVRAIAGRIEEVREQRFRRPPIAVRAPDTMRQVAADIRAFNVLTRERLEARGRSWADIGLGGTGSPAVLFRTVAGDLEGIGFDPAGNRLLVAPDRLTEEDFITRHEDDPDATVLMMTGVRPDEPLVSHLLMHVRQLERESHDSLEESTDRLLAHAAWNEGEANLLAVKYLFQGMGVADQVIALRVDPGDVLEGRLVPTALKELSGVEASLVDFVYLEGYALAVEHYVDGGWPALDRAMSTQRTTAQILHPDAEPLAEPDFGSPPSPGVEGLTLADTDSLGEQAIVVLVSVLSGKDNLGLQAGDGWAGDRLYRWEIISGERAGTGVTVWDTRWRNAEEAADFEYALGRSLKARFPGGKLESAGEDRRYLAADGRLFDLRHDGVRVTLRITPDALAPPLLPEAEPKTD
jgi:hypothetical protein